MVLQAAPALADDPTPSPTPTITVSATPVPTPILVPTPTATATTPPNPSTNVPPVGPPQRLKLPLRKGHYGRLVTDAQQKLLWLGYDVAPSNLKLHWFGNSMPTEVERFQSKFYIRPTGVIDKATWKALARLATPVGVLPNRCTEVKVALCADKTSRIIRYVVNGKVKLTLDARFGLPGMDTGDGVFTVNRKSRDHVSTAYHTWMPFAMFFNGGEAVHYSPYFARDGYNGGSHGCIGVRDIKAAEWLYDRVPIGARVYVYYS